VSWRLSDKVAIVGIGQTAFSRAEHAGKTAFRLALESILDACSDAALDPTEVDGFVTYGVETTDPYTLAQTLGISETHFMDRYPGGGESLAATIHHAAMAIAAGVAKTVVAYRSLSGRLIPRNNRSEIQEPDNGAFRASFLAPFGAFVPVHFYALQAKRHMIDFGTTSRQFGSYAVNLNANAQRNPNAIHYGRQSRLRITKRVP
jgi:acetyl-CoA acetyltransferase